MQIKEISVSKSDVMAEVAETTMYTAAKQEEMDEATMRRIATVDADEEHLERFWNECRADLAQMLIGVVVEEGGEEPYRVRLNVSGAFDDALLPSMQVSLRSFFVQEITAKWYVYANKGEAEAYKAKAVQLLEDIDRKARFKKAPTRPARKEITE